MLVIEIFLLMKGKCAAFKLKLALKLLTSRKL